MSNVGYGTLVVIPSVRGISGAVASQVTAPLNSAGQSAGRSFGSKLVGGVATGVKAVVGTVLAVGGAVATVAATGGINRALNIQDARASLAGLGHDTQSIEGIMGSALDAVRGTAFGLDQAASTAATAVAAGIKPGQELTRTLKLTADAATIAKTPLSEMGSIVNKVATAGYLTRDVVNQLQDRGIPILQLVAQQYGVTAEAASEMVSKGEVDFATFQNALEQGMGGAALKSGETARGAFANVGAALSRLGAMFVQPAIEGSPALFQSVAGATDRAATALKPYADMFGAWLAPAIARTAAYIDTVDFGKIVGGLQGIYDLVVQGDFTAGLREAFNVEEDTPVVRVAIRVHDALTGLYALIVQGNFTGALRSAFNIEEDSGFVVFVLGAREAVSQFISSITQGDLSGAASSIGQSLSTLAPAFSEFGAQLPNIGGAVATLVGAGLNVLVNVLSFLADNVDTIIAFMPVIVGGFLAWKAASAVVFASQQNLALLQLRMMPLTTANTFARLAAARAELQVAAATGTSTAAQNGGVASTVRQTAATIASKAAMIATRGAMLVATAAQWAWNAALNANPISIIILAIAALVAGLVWFFTQTELGRAIWESVMAAIGAAITWLWESVIQPVFNFIGAIFTWIYENIIYPIVLGILLYIGLWAAAITWLWENVVSPVFAFIGSIFTWIYENIIVPIVNGVIAYFQAWGAIFTWLYQNIVVPVFNAIGAVFQWIYQNVIVPIVAGIQAAIRAAGAVFSWLWQNAINPAFQAVAGAFNWVWGSIISPVANWIGDAIRNVGNVFGSVFNAIPGVISAAFSGLVGIIRGPINGVIGLANSAIRALNGISVTIPDWVPEIGGSTFGISIPQIPMLAAGANIRARRGGTMAILGEGGRAETVTDLGLTNRMMAATLALVSDASGGGTDESINFHGPVTVADPDELIEKMQKRRRRAKARAGVDKKVVTP